MQIEQEDKWNGLTIFTPSYTLCAKCNLKKYVTTDYILKKWGYYIFKFLYLFTHKIKIII